MLIHFSGFSNLNLRTVTTRATKITDISTDIGLRLSTQSPLSIYPEFSFTGAAIAPTQLYYASSSSGLVNSLCTDQDFTIGIWRLVTRSRVSLLEGTYRKVLDYSLTPCANDAFTPGIVCCELHSPNSSDVASGDILGILHGPDSSLFHEVGGDPQLDVLFGEDGDMVTPSRLPGFLSAQQGYPLLTLEPGKCIIRPIAHNVNLKVLCFKKLLALLWSM